MLKKVLIPVILLGICILSACGKAEIKSVSGTGIYFDTIVSLTVYGTDDRKVIDELFNECRRYEKIFSTTDKESELYRINESREKSIAVSKDMYDCMSEALSYSRATNGAYDITIRPVSKLWDFHSGTNIVPDAEAISEGLKKVNYESVKLKKEADGYYIEFADNETEIELGSAAKGYIGDRLIEFLKGKGFTSAVISLGGNVQCLGSKPEEDQAEADFNVALKDPFDPEGGIFEVVQVRDKAVVTSGIYERCFNKDGKLYHHILDAKTGMPVESDIVSVTVITGSGLKADILSTVCFITGYEGSRELLKDDKEVKVKFIYKDGSEREI